MLSLVTAQTTTQEDAMTMAQRITARLSSGPGCPSHTLVLTGGDYLYEIAGQWWFQQPGQLKQAVSIAVSGESVAVRS
jgi:hypothetical protein